MPTETAATHLMRTDVIVDSQSKAGGINSGVPGRPGTCTYMYVVHVCVCVCVRVCVCVCVRVCERITLGVPSWPGPYVCMYIHML